MFPSQRGVRAVLSREPENYVLHAHSNVFHPLTLITNRSVITWDISSRHWLSLKTNERARGSVMTKNLCEISSEFSHQNVIYVSWETWIFLHERNWYTLRSQWGFYPLSLISRGAFFKSKVFARPQLIKFVINEGEKLGKRGYKLRVKCSVVCVNLRKVQKLNNVRLL